MRTLKAVICAAVFLLLLAIVLLFFVRPVLLYEKGEDDKNQETVMDKKTFEAWEFETFDPDKILEIPYKAMTEEEIAAIQP